MSVITQLKTIQANAHTYYLQLHQIHWLVQGPRFKAMHEMTEGYYERMSEMYDDAAERLLQKGAMPLLSIDELKVASTLAPLSDKVFDEKAVLAYVEKMLKHLIDSYRTLAETADDEGDRTTAALADDQLEVLEKEEWMLLATKGEAKYV
ncbi:Dps family protein [Hydrogenovibrio marinus]|uniref:Ferritin/DPS domain-containing protein n=1 Tax=Hydrogenovibrio marinus TaxID=28885 RepID=A0A066ZY61_HYDMR|nr:DNA starvation/stationary phase protection protein [Hydrogenovibrio marinus]KDN95286.1 hypothetical protein EI16_03000 [Hydrogenovibrio marinus]BBN59766.1 DNA starvation/stationary phase protection protein [Hydrogenovibrio marinus]